MDENQSLLETLEILFGEEPFNPVEEELFQWFLFAYLGKGRRMNNLDSLNFALFKEKINILIEAIYKKNPEATN